METEEKNKSEEIASITNESQMIVVDRWDLAVQKLEKGESIIVKMIGGWGKAVQVPYGGDKLEGYETFYRYEFEVIEGVQGLLEADPTIVRIWDTREIYFKKLNPMVQEGHKKFRITKTRVSKRTEWGHEPNYEIEAIDEANPASAISP